MAGGSKMVEIQKFNPALETAQALKEMLVARDEESKTVLDCLLKTKPDASPPQFILIGPRGMGKTHLLLFIYYTVKNILPWQGDGKKFFKAWIPILIAEETYAVLTLEDLFQEILKRLQEELSITAYPLPLSEPDFVEKAVYYLKKLSKERKKRYLLLIDNLHEILGILPEKDHERFRAILQNNPIFSIIGTATFYFDAIANYKMPFYNFFHPVWLHELDFKEIKEFLLKRLKRDEKQEIIEKFDQYEPKIRTITHLTGGNPRLILSLYQIVTEFKIEAVEKQLFTLLDELTPYLRDVVNDVPVQQRKILEIIALKGEPITPTEIAKTANIAVTTITSQLKRLAERGLVKSLKIKGRRETLYDIKDRLFSLWRQMRQEAGRKRLGFIVRFLKIWYSEKELEKIALEMIKYSLKAVSEGKKEAVISFSDKLYYLAEAMPSQKPDLHSLRIESLILSGNYEKAREEIEELKKEAEQKKDERLLAKIILGEASLYYIKKNYEKAIEGCKKAIEIKPDMHEAWYNLGVAYNKIDKLNEAIEAYKKAIEIKPDMHEAWCNLGVAYNKQGKLNEAIKAYKKAIEIKPDQPYACANLAHTLSKKNKISEGVKFAKKAIFLAKKEKDPKFPKDEFIKRVSTLLLYYYLLLSSKAFKRGNYPKVISYLEEALKIVSQAEPAPAGEAFSTYLKDLIKMADADFSIKILKLIKEKGTEDLKEFLKPFMIALSYLEKKDEMILLRTPEEFKPIVKEILSEINKDL